MPQYRYGYCGFFACVRQKRQAWLQAVNAPSRKILHLSKKTLAKSFK
jgi:hypothetical protein